MNTVPANQQRARTLVQALRERGCPSAARWREHANRCFCLALCLKKRPCEFEMEFRQCLRIEGWTAAEAAPLAKELAALPSVEIRLALEAELGNAYEMVAELKAGRRRDFSGEKV